ncbi:PAS domain S-box protein [Schlesneria paludicola]|uniref:PAS domain S-box protein n=1 Tax=Schlesneria paludicola TaxID=360056 RepID=UPI00138AB570|nr:PAS domain S-box protein [Schlesneria paludicola]
MLVTILVRWRMQDALGERGLYSTFLPAVILAAHFGGIWPGLIITVVSAVVTNFLLVDNLLKIDHLAAADTVALLLFVGTGIVISALSEALHRAYQRRLILEQQRHAQMTLRKTEERFTHLMQQSSDIIGIFAPDGTILYQTPSLTRILGYLPEERIGKNVFADSTVHPDDRPAQREFFESILKRPELPVKAELRMRHAKGGWRDIEAIGQILLDEAGLLVLIANYRDMTDRKAAERTIRESEQRWRSLTQMLPQLIWTAKPDGTTDYYSPQFLSFSGKTTAELVNAGWHSVIPADELALVVERWKSAVSQAANYDLEHRLLRSDGVERWFKVQAVPVRDDDGRLLRWIGSATDITEVKEAERTSRLAKEAAESANRAKDEFLANVSHEIRTPMNAILGMTDLVLDSNLNASQRNLLEVVKAAGGNLLDIINDLLDFSKIAAGKLELDPTLCSPRQITMEVVQILEFKARAQGLHLRCDIAEAIPESLLADAGRLRQILINLAMNAIKFTPKGEVVLQLILERSTPRDATLKFLVRDTGIGIAAEKQQSIFNAFEQEDASTTRKYGGTGLGLTIASRLVRAMGGEIELESVVHKGSTFQFRLTFVKPSEPVHVETSQRMDHGLKPSGNGRASIGVPSLKILVAEDNRFNAQLIDVLLRQSQHQFQIVPDGEQTLALALSQSFDLLLLDIHMPIKDGFMVIRELRQWESHDPSRGRLPVIALTAMSTQQATQQCLAAGMDAVLAKPIRPNDLAAAIQRVVTTSANAQASQEDLIDSKMVLSVCGGSDEVLQLLVHSFLENVPSQLRELQEWSTARDLASLREAAHKSASALRTFSRKAGNLALQIEDTAVAGDLAECQRTVSQLNACCETLLHQVQSLSVQDLQSRSRLVDT